jgi:hypothetical protein
MDSKEYPGWSVKIGWNPDYLVIDWGWEREYRQIGDGLKLICRGVNQGWSVWGDRVQIVQGLSVAKD